MLLGMYSGNLGFSVSIPNHLVRSQNQTPVVKIRERERERGKEEEKERKRERERERERERKQICLTGTDVFSICFRK